MLTFVPSTPEDVGGAYGGFVPHLALVSGSGGFEDSEDSEDSGTTTYTIDPSSGTVYRSSVDSAGTTTYTITPGGSSDEGDEGPGGFQSSSSGSGGFGGLAASGDLARPNKGDYGFWWTKRGQQRRAKRKSKRAGKRRSKYQKCVDKRGADHKKCQRKLKYAKRTLSRAEKRYAKYKKKGGTDELVELTEAQALFKPAKAWDSSRTRLKVEARGGTMERGGYTEDDYSEELSSGASAAPSNLPLILGGIAALGVGGFLIFALTKKPKKALTAA